MAERPLWPGDRYGLSAFILHVKFFNNIKIMRLYLLLWPKDPYGQETVMAERPLWPGDRYGLSAEIENALKFFLAIQGLRKI